MNEKPKIDYPCIWTYKLIGEDSEKITASAEEILGRRKYGLKASNVSSKGKYKSMTLKIEVEDETDRNLLYEKLKNSSSIKIII